MLLPVQRGTRLGQFIVTIAGAGDSQGDIGGVSRDFIGHATLLDVILFRQAQMFLWRDVAQHAGAVITGGGGADATGDVVIAGKDVGHQGSEDVKRRAMAKLALKLHVVFDLIERHMAGPFDHHLHALGPGALGQFAERGEFAKLGFIGGVGQIRRDEGRRRG